jgi:hypothetical protein
LIVAAAGPWAVFFLNSASFVGVLFVLYRWQRQPIESISPAERVMGAMRAGLRYVRHAPDLKAVLVRTAVFGSCASALWALLPLIARLELGRGALGYGMLLGGLGLGAIAAAMILPTLRRTLTINRLVVVGSLIFAFTTFTLAIVQSFILLCLVMIIGGIAWMSVMSSFNIGVQTIVPEWVRARALAIYLLVFYGSLTGGSLIWGAVANRIGIRDTLLSAAAMLVVGLLVGLRYRMRIGGELNLEPSLHWTEPAVVVEPELDAGPVLVLTEYQIDPKDSLQFLEAMAEMGRIYQRDGASQWGVFQDPAFPGRYMNTFLVESWAEHLRQHARVTMEDRAVQQRARAFHKGDSPPRVSHLIAEDTRKFRRRRNGLR